MSGWGESRTMQSNDRLHQYKWQQKTQPQAMCGWSSRAISEGTVAGWTLLVCGALFNPYTMFQEQGDIWTSEAHWLIADFRNGTKLVLWKRAVSGNVSQATQEHKLRQERCWRKGFWVWSAWLGPGEAASTSHPPHTFHTVPTGYVAAWYVGKGFIHPWTHKARGLGALLDHRWLLCHMELANTDKPKWIRHVFSAWLPALWHQRRR